MQILLEFDGSLPIKSQAMSRPSSGSDAANKMMLYLYLSAGPTSFTLFRVSFVIWKPFYTSAAFSCAPLPLVFH